MNYWLQRISYEGSLSYPLLEKGFLSMTTFALPICRKAFIEKVSNQGRDFFEKTVVGIGRNKWALWRFIAEMKKGDVVIIPDSRECFSIYKIENDEILLPWDILLGNNNGLEDIKSWKGESFFFAEDFGSIVTKSNNERYGYEMHDIGFFRKVQPVCLNIPRSGADAVLTSRMKIKNINANISDLEKNILLVHDAFGVPNKINLEEDIVNTTCDEWLKTIRHDLNPDKFEQLIGLYFKQIGGTFEIPPKSERDKFGNVDIIATFENIKTIINVQTKFHTGDESSFPVRQISDYEEFIDDKQETWLSDGYTRQYWVISTANYFTEEAIEVASENRVSLIGGKQFVRMLTNVGIQIDRKSLSEI